MDELVSTIKLWVERYFALFPFERKEVYAKMLTDPDRTMAAEAKRTSAGVGFKDMLIGLLPFIFIMLAIIIVVSAAIMAILYFAGQLGTVTPYIAPAIGIILAGLLAYILVVAIGWVLGTLSVHLIAKILGGKGSFGKMLGLTGTLSAVNGLLMVPVTLISIIPIIGQVTMLVSIYIIYLEYKAVKEVHGIDRNRSIVAVLVPVAIIAAIAVAFYVVYILAMMGLSAAS